MPKLMCSKCGKEAGFSTPVVFQCTNPQCAKPLCYNCAEVSLKSDMVFGILGALLGKKVRKQVYINRAKPFQEKACPHCNAPIKKF